MKKIYMTIAFLVLGTGFCFSQSFGVRGGVNLSNIGGDAVNNSIRPGFHLGAYYTKKVGINFIFEPEIQLSTQGSNAEDASMAFNQSLTYINIPLTFKYRLSDQFNVNAVPYFGMLLGASIDSDLLGNIDNSESFKTFDFGMGLGADYSISDNISVQVRYLFGLADITDDGGTEVIEIDGFPVEVEVEEQTITNRVFQLSVGYTINQEL